MMQQIIDLLPLASNIVIFFGMFALQWRVIGALDKALERQQAPAPVVDVQKPGPASQPPTHPLAGATSPVPAPINPHDFVTEGLVAFVKKEEGFSAKAYGDYKQYSIGYGTRAKSADEVIDIVEADKRCRAELAEAAASVEHFIPNAPIGVKQAMTDATYNFGPVWQHNDLGSLLVGGNYDDAKQHLMQYVHAGNPPKVLDDLVKRRAKECEMFDNPI